MVESIFSHRSIRKYSSKPVEETILKEVIEAGIRASNTGNMQVYSIIITKEADLRQKLWEVHFRQNMVVQAPVHITFCVDVNRFHKWCEASGTTVSYDNFLWFTNGVIDAVLASQNVCVEAESKGLGICYLGTTTYNAQKIIEILDLPKGVVPITAITLGYPDENPPLTDRLPFEAVVHYEKYQDYSQEQIKTLFAGKENAEFSKKLVLENGVRNFASVFTEKRYKRTDNIHFSKQFLEVLKNQGFFNHE
jgi:nitroreductase